jgi:hypothetical protein
MNRRVIDCVVATENPIELDRILGLGGSPNATEYDSDRQPGTALWIAVYNGHGLQVDTLIRHGADVNARDINGATPLMAAVDPTFALATWPSGPAWSHLKVAALLLASGANPNIQRTDGGTALMIASKGGNPNYVTLLLEKGADVNARSKDGSTALMIAASEGFLDVAKHLVDGGSDLKATNANGKTAVDLAMISGRSDMVAVLTSNLPEAEKPGSSPERWATVPHIEGPSRVVRGVLSEVSSGSRGGTFTLKTSDGQVMDFGYYDAPNEPPLPADFSLLGLDDVGKSFDIQFRDVTYTGRNPGTSPRRIEAIRKIDDPKK